MWFGVLSSLILLPLRPRVSCSVEELVFCEGKGWVPVHAMGLGRTIISPLPSSPYMSAAASGVSSTGRARGPRPPVAGTSRQVGGGGSSSAAQATPLSRGTQGSKGSVGLSVGGSGSGTPLTGAGSATPRGAGSGELGSTPTTSDAAGESAAVRAPPPVSPRGGLFGRAGGARAVPRRALPPVREGKRLSSKTLGWQPKPSSSSE